MKFIHGLMMALASTTLASSNAAVAASQTEAAELGKSLTPLGGEKAGNKDGSIPSWDGGYTKPIPGFKNGGKRDQSPFDGEKPLYTVTAKNMAQYSDKLTEGTKAMLQKNPSYRLDVYPTHRTGAAPQWVYDNTAKNAVRAKLDEHQVPVGAFGGIPFPIPKTGAEVVWNHLLRWRGSDIQYDMQSVLVTTEGKPVMTVDALGDQSMPYYYKDGSVDGYNGVYWMLKLVNAGPPIRAGEAILGHLNMDPNKDQAWVYLAGQRRTRKLPNACCDTPTPSAAGVMTFDEIEVFSGRITLFDWKLVGKKEILIPYNTNKIYKPTSYTDLVGSKHLNPDYVRWELHRVWVVEAALKPGQRHVAPKGTYYFDEDTWFGVLADRYDAKGQLWKTLWQLPVMMPDLPATTSLTFGFYDLLAGTWFVSNTANAKAMQYKQMPRYAPSTFAPDSLSGGGLR